VTVTANGGEWANITVSQLSFHSSYAGYFPDEPAPGNVYVQVWVTYKALQDGVSYNQFDWSFFNNDVATGDSFTFVSNGPEPTLSSGDLPAGRTAEGWIVTEVPVSGRLVMSYSGSFFNQAPVFEVVLRPS
jgi:hypothetical protein